MIYLLFACNPFQLVHDTAQLGRKMVSETRAVMQAKRLQTSLMSKFKAFSRLSRKAQILLKFCEYKEVCVVHFQV